MRLFRWNLTCSTPPHDNDAVWLAYKGVSVEWVATFDVRCSGLIMSSHQSSPAMKPPGKALSDGKDRRMKMFGRFQVFYSCVCFARCKWSTNDEPLSELSVFFLDLFSQRDVICGFWGMLLVSIKVLFASGFADAALLFVTIFSSLKAAFRRLSVVHFRVYRPFRVSIDDNFDFVRSSPAPMPFFADFIADKTTTFPASILQPRDYCCCCCGDSICYFT